ncbi:GFA family protein [Fangia hongkongensis]|uniref:GFA family protein n=1 Tax=Fangia hongkongensis TaxID=270495 RepID=UPI00036EFE53|nr:GFA family protein [Fangia hongkongensis]MBK2126199.1 GFA family protein [Fangia hongkongensis]
MQLKCDCERVEIEFAHEPIASLYCHCADCRSLTKMPVYQGMAFEKKTMNIVKGQQSISSHQFHTHALKRYFCRECGCFLYALNRLGFVTTSAFNFSQEDQGTSQPSCHLFYGEGVIQMDDELIKYQKGSEDLKKQYDDKQSK